MADLLPVNVPTQYSRGVNKSLHGPCPIPNDEKFSYGTAGFRNKAEKLTFIVYRCAYLAGLRARVTNSTIGLMITASHNPACDNGVKIVDPTGDMLALEWEKYATELVNSTDEQFPTAVRALEVQINASNSASKAKVVCAIDTRESGPHLMLAAKSGAALFNVEFENIGVLTTPQLHFIVRCNNDKEFGKPTEFGYYDRITSSFKELYNITNEPQDSKYTNQLTIDCANGVGARRFKDLLKMLDEKYLKVIFRNTDGILNHDCGADFVKIAQKPPSNFDENDHKCASFDGDADRLIYFSVNGKDSIRMMDGDKIAILIATYIKKYLDVFNDKAEKPLSFGIVQTAYANGNSSRYIRQELGVEPEIVPTGVKNLHHAAKKYDIGVYFEANGHGTVIFSDNFENIVKRLNEFKDDAHDSLNRLALFSRVINKVVGDAFADLLAVEICLRHFGWSMDCWDHKLYQDIPNIQIKVPVNDRSIFKTTWEETTLLQPEDMQGLIDKQVALFLNARAFIRPSGTENIVRIYAESEKADDANVLGENLKKLLLERGFVKQG